MIVLLNLTLVPLITLFIPPTLIGNATLPAQPLSPELVSATLANGTAVPLWIVDSKIYVLSGGEPVKVVYVPRYFNSSGSIIVPINSPYEVWVHIPSGTYPVDVPDNAEIRAVNRTGVYLTVPPGNYNVSYTLLVTEKEPINATPPTKSPSISQQTTAREGETTTAGRSAIGEVVESTPMTRMTDTTQAQWNIELVLTVLLVGSISAAAYMVLRRRGSDCGGLGETDIQIIRYLEEAGGEAYRQDIARALGLPPTTLHKHLHKLAKRGLLRLVEEHKRHRVVLLRGC